ncbi:MAG: hypothetical protein IPK83_17055 [Planctomycetes bacterium]|nr:hypothetical protein [Planctomycetota bacterium]
MQCIAYGAASHIERYDFSDFGNADFYGANGQLLDSSQYGANSLFAGRVLVPGLQLLDYRSRLLDPRSGQFVHRDVLGILFDSGSHGNARTYVANNPWTYLDPSGSSLCRPICHTVFQVMCTFSPPPIYQLLCRVTGIWVCELGCREPEPCSQVEALRPSPSSPGPPLVLPPSGPPVGAGSAGSAFPPPSLRPTPPPVQLPAPGDGGHSGGSEGGTPPRGDSIVHRFGISIFQRVEST